VTARVFAAIDLGASGGRVVAGVVDGTTAALDVIHRFPNGVREHDGHLRWDFTGLYREVLTGLALLADRHPRVESIGIDTWGVDYGLLDVHGALLGEPIAYRDDRTARSVDHVHARVAPEQLYRVTGVQFLPLNTVYQLAAEPRDDRWERVAHVVLLPDLLAYWLTGELRTEYTNATTTGLVDLHSRTWSAEVLDAIDVPERLFPAIEQPGAVRGALRPGVCLQTGLAPTTIVTTVGSHDTASAVVAVPAIDRNVAYVSSGTWSLVGVELDEPIVSDAARASNFTNEGGVDGRVRFLRNVGGLWLLQECMRDWTELGTAVDVATLLGDAASLPVGGPVFDVDDPALVSPGGMPARIAAAVAEQGGAVPSERSGLVRSIVDSLACAYGRTIRDAVALSGRAIGTVHVVGGGSQNPLLCRLTAQAVDRPVVAGPVEATALGNVLVQARAHGALPQSLDELRVRVAHTMPLARYDPTPNAVERR
jgi:rhamnulokinase